MKISNNILALSIVLLSLLTAFEPLTAQAMRRNTPRSSDELMIRRAESLARGGKTNQAVDLYIELLSKNPRKTNLYFRIADLLPGKENAVTLIQILEDIQNLNPDNHNLTAEKGRLLYLLDRRDEAMDTWQKLIQGRKERYIYSVVSNTMIRAGAMDDAINTLKNARITLNEPEAFTLELARIYAIQHDYQNASFEYVKHLDRNPRTLNHVSNQLIYLLKNDGALPLMELSFNTVLAQEGTHQSVYLALAKVYQHVKRYDDCLIAIRSLDKKETISDIMTIGKDLKAEEAWSHAAELFLIVSSTSTDNRMRGEALLNLAAVYEEQLAEKQTFESLASYYGGNPFFELDLQVAHGKGSELDRTFQLYDSLQAVMPRSHSAMEATYRIADLRLTTSGDVDRAISGFKQVFDQAGTHRLKVKAGRRLADAWLVKGDAQQATVILEDLINRLNLDEDEPEIIATRIRILIHRGDLPELRKELLNLSGAALPGNRLFNDALEMLSLIEGNGGAEDETLKRYFSAERLIGQHKLSQAEDMLEEFQGRDTGIADEARIRAIQIMFELEQWSRAKSALTRFLEDFPQSSWRPTALVWMAEHLQFREVDPMASIPFYEAVIIEHPEFLGVHEVRLRVREILGAGS